MDTKTSTLIGTPPRLMNSVLAGFNTVASHIQLIAIPVLVDLFIWFGPHLRINTLVQPLLNEWMQTVLQVGSSDMRQMVVANKALFQALFEQFNLFSLLRTWPVGVPSLMAPLGAMQTPLGSAPIWEAASYNSAVLAWIGLLLLGVVIGSLYFSAVAYFSADFRPTRALRWAAWSILQTLLLSVGVIIAILAASIPAVLILSILTLISPGISQLVLLAASFFILWSLLPLVFSPHGIFAYGQSALVSLLTSARLVRRYLPGTGLFCLTVILLSEGLDVVWRAAPPNSWMTLVGIAGHAFITTSLLAASFIYYQGGIRWMQESLQQMAAKPQNA